MIKPLEKLCAIAAIAGALWVGPTTYSKALEPIVGEIGFINDLYLSASNAPQVTRQLNLDRILRNNTTAAALNPAEYPAALNPYYRKAKLNLGNGYGSREPETYETLSEPFHPTINQESLRVSSETDEPETVIVKGYEFYTTSTLTATFPKLTTSISEILKFQNDAADVASGIGNKKFQVWGWGPGNTGTGYSALEGGIRFPVSNYSFLDRIGFESYEIGVVGSYSIGEINTVAVAPVDTSVSPFSLAAGQDLKVSIFQQYIYRAGGAVLRFKSKPLPYLWNIKLIPSGGPTLVNLASLTRTTAVIDGFSNQQSETRFDETELCFTYGLGIEKDFVVLEKYEASFRLATEKTVSCKIKGNATGTLTTNGVVTSLNIPTNVDLSSKFPAVIASVSVDFEVIEDIMKGIWNSFFK